MATGQSLLDRMELFNPELQLQSGETDVARGLLALNVAQDYFETRAALRKDVFGSTSSTVTTTQNQETTTYPTALLRIDRLQFIDPSTSRPAWDLTPIRRTGGHSWGGNWPSSLGSSTTGRPTGYWTNGVNIYWDPLPSGTHTVRWYGFQGASDLTAGGTFAYPDIVMLPVAVFATRLLKAGLDDPIQDLDTLAQRAFDPVLDLLTNFNRDGAKGFEYERAAET